MEMHTSFRSRLVADGILFPTGIDGLWGRNGTFEAVYDGLDRAITRAGLADGAEVMRFPPAMAQKTFEKSGYMKPSSVIGFATAAGFKLAGKSEVNANPKDTADWAGGVWTLPPSYALKDVDRAKYAAIGESDRMTLKFVKPR